MSPRHTRIVLMLAAFVAGLVLCATSVDFMPNALVRNAYQAGMLSATVMARLAWPTRLPMQVPMVNLRGASMPAWAAGEMRRHDWRMIIEAGHSICTYNARRWIGDVDVPTSVIMTMRDHVVPLRRQLKLARKFNTMRRVYREALPTLSSKQKWESVLLESSNA